MSGVHNLRAMTRHDIALGMRLCRLSLWNQVEDDWHAFLDPAAGGGWLAEKDGQAVGTVAYLRYGRCFTWLSMMLVDPGARRTGVGRQLLEAGLNSLREESCIRLDATPAGEPLYRQYGFVPEYELARAKVTVAAARFRPREGALRAIPIAPGDLAEIFVRDRQVFGADRSGLLASFYGRRPEFAWMMRSEGSLVGYCFGRPGYRYQQLGPIVARSPSGAGDLVSHCLSGQEGHMVAIDAPRLVPEWSEWLGSSGLEWERPFLRMRRGENRYPGIRDCQFGIAGPEFG